jgi:hypothetical protein
MESRQRTYNKVRRFLSPSPILPKIDQSLRRNSHSQSTRNLAKNATLRLPRSKYRYLDADSEMSIYSGPYKTFDDIRREDR